MYWKLKKPKIVLLKKNYNFLEQNNFLFKYKVQRSNKYY
jgi:hypothetical protein